MLPSSEHVAESNNSEVIGFIASTVENIRDRVGVIEQRMVTIEQHDASVTAVRGDIEQVHLRLDSMEHSIASRFENVEGEISRLRSAVYVLGKDRPDVLRLLGHQTS